MRLWLQAKAGKVGFDWNDIRAVLRKIREEADEIEAALEIMSKGILDHGGVIADFQGDAVMGFWGWPLAAPNQITEALQAALDISRRFAEASGFTQQYVSDLERGRRNPTVVTLFELANTLGVSHVDLVLPDDEARSERTKTSKRK